MKNSSILDVEESLGGARWVFPDIDDGEISRIIQNHDLPEFIARLLHVRGVSSEEVEEFLYPTLKKHFPDPFSLADMQVMAKDIAGRIANGGEDANPNRIGIFADFDVDGATSSAILARFLRHFGLTPPVYIPDRLKEGYGPGEKGLVSLKEQGAELVIIADCGITAFEPIAKGREMGLEIAIIDHHEAEEKLPDASYIIDPKRKDDTSGLDTLAACGLCFLACVAINNELRKTGFYKNGTVAAGNTDGIKEPDIKSMLDIVALGTVCDMVPLMGANRLLVRKGMQQMASGKTPGINALCEVSKISDSPDISHLGWSLGPRINSGSRIHKSHLGYMLLATDDVEEAQSIAWNLENCNKERKKLQSEMVKHAIKKITDSNKKPEDLPVIIVADESWQAGHSGLSGLVAGRLKERFGKPAICITYVKNQDGKIEGRGSGRSVPGVHMAKAFIDARNEGLLIKGGGHAMAGGFTLDISMLGDFTAFLHEHIKNQMQHIDIRKEVTIDTIATISGSSVDAIKLVENNIGPFGQGNPAPVFALSNVRIRKTDILKEKHIRLMISDWEGGKWIKAMLFGGVGSTLGDIILKKGKDIPFHLVGEFKLNKWQGRESVEFHISDGAITAHDNILAGREVA